MTWTILSAVVQVLLIVAKYVNEKQLLSAGQKIAIADGLRQAAAALVIAAKTDADTDAKHKADPTDSAFDPEFRRDDP